MQNILLKLNVFLTNDKLKQQSKIWDKFNNIIKNGFDNKPVYNEKYLKTVVKLYEGKINTNLLDN